MKNNDKMKHINAYCQVQSMQENDMHIKVGYKKYLASFFAKCRTRQRRLQWGMQA